MTKTLKENYSRNLAIMKENLKRGFPMKDAYKVIDTMQKQFENSNLYGKEEKLFIAEMKAAVASHFSGIEITIAK